MFARMAPAGSWSAGLHLAPEAAVLHALCLRTLAGEAASKAVPGPPCSPAASCALSATLSGICRVAPLKRHVTPLWAPADLD